MAEVPFDQLDGHIWMNGEFLPWKDAKIHVLTHGLHYASAVFEGEDEWPELIVSVPGLAAELRRQEQGFGMIPIGK